PAARSFHSRARTRTSRSREATACSAWRARSRPWSPPTRESASRPLFSARRPPPYRSCGAWAPGESRAPERCSSCPRSSRPRPPPRRSSSRRGSPAPPSWSAARIRDAPEGEDLRMSFLRSIEQRVEGLIEGAFGRAFRTHVQPVELARKLTKEMDDHRTISVSKVYVPNEYTVYLAPDDRDQFSSYENSLVDELRQHLTEHARRERHALLTHPRVVLEPDGVLAVGEFGIATRMVQPEGGAEEGAEGLPAAAGQTMVYRKERAGVPTEAASPVELGVEEAKA